jgi:hypothetical protein
MDHWNDEFLAKSLGALQGNTRKQIQFLSKERTGDPPEGIAAPQPDIGVKKYEDIPLRGLRQSLASMLFTGPSIWQSHPAQQPYPCVIQLNGPYHLRGAIG